MNTNGRKLWRHAAGLLTGVVLLSMTCETTVMANDVSMASVTGEADMYAQTEQAALAAMTSGAEDNIQTAEAQAQAQAAAEAQAKAAAEAQAKAAAEAQAQAAAQTQAEAMLQGWTAIAAQRGFTSGDLELLAALIHCEAVGESYVGQVAVGNVVINRILSPAFPNSLTEVVYDRGQFTPVSTGRLQQVLASGNISASCRQAALEAAAGSAPVGDKLYFRRVNGRSGQIIGNHVFY